jgi:GTP-binding protein
MRNLVAVVGRPNVGKSTLVNRLVGQRAAIVDPTAGVTRDRLYLDADWAGRAFTLVDTGGLDFGSDLEMSEAIHTQALIAADEADLILFVVDSQAGVLPQDSEVADLLRRNDKPVLLVANKVDRPDMPLAGELYALGLGEPWPVSATHGTGTGDLLDEVVAKLPERPLEERADDLAIAVVGRPNAGKSTLVNALLGEDRAVVSEKAGTTRDAVDSVLERDGMRVRVVDTAGLRRKSKAQDLEFYSRVRALAALERADLAVLLIDAEAGPADQDQHIAGEAVSRGCALVVGLSKWDLVPKEERESRFAAVQRSLRFVPWAQQITLDAPRGKGLDPLWSAIEAAAETHSGELPTPRLNAFLQDLKARGHTVSKRGKILRLSYAVQTGTRPPRFLFFANHPELADTRFRSYVEGRMRQAFDLDGTPIRIGFSRK